MPLAKTSSPPWRFILLAAISLALSCSRVQAADELTLGVHPYLAASELHHRFTPLAELLSRQLNHKVNVRISPTYEAHVAAVVKGEYQLALMGPAPYIQLTKQAGPLPLLAAFETQGQRTFRGAIAVRKESRIQDLAGLKGKTLALGPPPSTMSNIVPRAMLLMAGLPVSALDKVQYLTNHENIALGILVGQFDAGAMKEDVFRRFEAQGLRAIAFSDPIPDHLFVAWRDLPTDMIERIRKTLYGLGASEAGRRILASIQDSLTALVPVKDSDYDQLRNLIRALDS